MRSVRSCSSVCWKASFIASSEFVLLCVSLSTLSRTSRMIWLRVSSPSRRSVISWQTVCFSASKSSKDTFRSSRRRRCCKSAACCSRDLVMSSSFRALIFCATSVSVAARSRVSVSRSTRAFFMRSSRLSNIARRKLRSSLSFASFSRKARSHSTSARRDSTFRSFSCVCTIASSLASDEDWSRTNFHWMCASSACFSSTDCSCRCHSS
mmetsp:Transcript_39772/g.93120  ORF Transcript_39772/g.93120 Transcript_39772/m.93120 type:complete len:209 (+) Transcript_39772:261-887(+)